MSLFDISTNLVSLKEGSTKEPPTPYGLFGPLGLLERWLTVSFCCLLPGRLARRGFVREELLVVPSDTQQLPRCLL